MEGSPSSWAEAPKFVEDNMSEPRLFLSRRNLLVLLSKLDRVKNGGESACTIIKRDDTHKKYPQSHPSIVITAVEDEEYYSDRGPGLMHPKDVPNG